MLAARNNLRTMTKLVTVVALMFAFGYALVPFYKKICEVTGINNLFQPDHAAANTQVVANRWVSIEFDANTHDLPWNFRPLTKSVRIHPGELTQVEYEIVNSRPYPVTGQAVPSYGPQRAAKYFRKLDCFCFTSQTLAAGETRRMPVVFVVDPTIPDELNTLTLSYTFFEVVGKTAKPT